MFNNIIYVQTETYCTSIDGDNSHIVTLSCRPASLLSALLHCNFVTTLAPDEDPSVGSKRVEHIEHNTISHHHSFIET